MPKIQIKRGSKAKLPTLAPGEFGLATDAGELYIGGAGKNLHIPVLGDDGTLPPSELPPMDYDPAGSAAAVQKALTAHTGNKNNPHAVTAEQVGASRAVKGTYPIAAGQSIQAGDVVDVVEGQVQKSATPVANVETVVNAGAVDCMAACDLNSEYAVVAEAASSGNNHDAHLISKKTGENVSEAVYFNEKTISSLSLARLSDTQFVVGWSTSNGGYIRIGSVSGGSISFGAQKAIGEGAEYHVYGFSAIALGLMVVIADSSPGALIDASVYQYEGNTIGSKVSSGSVSAWADIASTTTLPDDSSGKHRVCMCFSASNDGNKGKAVIATIDSANQVTWGDVAVFNDTYTVKPRCASNQKGNVVISYYSSSPVGIAARTCIVSGNTIIPRFTPLQITSTSGVIENTIVQIPGACVVSCENGNAYLLLNEGSELSLAATYKFLHSSGTSKSLDITAIANKQVLLCYSAAGNSGYGTSTILTASGNQIAGSFIDGSQDAIALKSGTAEQSIEVVYSGTVAADWVTEGQVISSPGVYGAGALDGVLQVWSKDRPVGTKIVTGSYIGTGTYGEGNPNSITFDFTPILFWVVKYRVEGTTYFSQEMSESPMIYTPILSENYTEGGGFYDDAAASRSYAKVADNGKTIIWYHKENANKQLNSSGYAYYYLAIG
ncbi:hypothetical protein NE670_07310 [Flavonifractor plautii]|uniref:hyaluronate lyase N-terminal domain-containing protein n=1 Tax=Flavonifractor plautii TaxID=292800 RepID=UPI00210A8D0E|nr:hypothetical protein [Flavonifractor plautii]MCQ4785058.1 hypothetical protein [Flavonifractor plautii]